VVYQDAGFRTLVEEVLRKLRRRERRKLWDWGRARKKEFLELRTAPRWRKELASDPRSFRTYL